ncbi:hypothetical protein HHK36_031329 [Tetracentron sinense]|uniref:Uncharacterized protein n=1 Tax=Tetracentron sinense TaxID=13715 RepID=A0A834YET5_TETSI|nr:hypothetical protein HHK36_031329 [Tetracentron sinense]
MASLCRSAAMAAAKSVGTRSAKILLSKTLSPKSMASTRTASRKHGVPHAASQRHCFCSSEVHYRRRLKLLELAFSRSGKEKKQLSVAILLKLLQCSSAVARVIDIVTGVVRTSKPAVEEIFYLGYASMKLTVLGPYGGISSTCCSVPDKPEMCANGFLDQMARGVLHSRSIEGVSFVNLQLFWASRGWRKPSVMMDLTNLTTNGMRAIPPETRMSKERDNLMHLFLDFWNTRSCVSRVMRERERERL